MTLRRLRHAHRAVERGRTRSRGATCCRWCSSPCCSASRSRRSASTARPLTDVLEALSQVFFRIVAHRDEGRADRRVRRDGVHGRHVRREEPAAARATDARRLPDDGAVHLRRAEPDPARSTASRSGSTSSSSARRSCSCSARRRARRRCRGCSTRWSAYGCARSVVGLVIPAGYSFNLDGTSIYLSMATMFIAQAFGVHLVARAAAQRARRADADVEGRRRRDGLGVHRAGEHAAARCAWCRSKAWRSCSASTGS